MSDVTIYWLIVMIKGRESKRIGTFSFVDFIKLRNTEKREGHEVHYKRERVHLGDI